MRSNGREYNFYGVKDSNIKDKRFILSASDTYRRSLQIEPNDLRSISPSSSFLSPDIFSPSSSPDNLSPQSRSRPLISSTSSPALNQKYPNENKINSSMPFSYLMTNKNIMDDKKPQLELLMDTMRISTRNLTNKTSATKNKLNYEKAKEKDRKHYYLTDSSSSCDDCSEGINIQKEKIPFTIAPPKIIPKLKRTKNVCESDFDLNTASSRFKKALSVFETFEQRTHLKNEKESKISNLSNLPSHGVYRLGLTTVPLLANSIISSVSNQ